MKGLIRYRPRAEPDEKDQQEQGGQGGGHREGGGKIAREQRAQPAGQQVAEEESGAVYAVEQPLDTGVQVRLGSAVDEDLSGDQEFVCCVVWVVLPLLGIAGCSTLCGFLASDEDGERRAGYPSEVSRWAKPSDPARRGPLLFLDRFSPLAL